MIRTNINSAQKSPIFCTRKSLGINVGRNYRAFCHKNICVGKGGKMWGWEGVFGAGNAKNEQRKFS